MKTAYMNFSEINDLQKEIMVFIGDWCRSKKTPVPQHEIVLAFTGRGVLFFTTVNALNVLVKKGYIRKSVMSSNTTNYIQLRTV